ncbi:MAG: 50S ribosomal protein L21, partial [Gammaproteobacteria bacterium]|nr:50S ribosomal protein L21 [Gammaproteobacteria bacterium]
MSKHLFAIIKSGNREYNARPGKVLRYHRIEAEPGETVEFETISKVVNGDNVIVGEPLIQGAIVRARVVKHENRKGTIVFRLKRRILYHRKSKHRFSFTKIKIDEIIINDLVLNIKDADSRKIKRALSSARKIFEKNKSSKPFEPAHAVSSTQTTQTNPSDSGSVNSDIAAAAIATTAVSDLPTGTHQPGTTAADANTPFTAKEPAALSDTNAATESPEATTANSNTGSEFTDTVNIDDHSTDSSHSEATSDSQVQNAVTSDRSNDQSSAADAFNDTVALDANPAKLALEGSASTPTKLEADTDNLNHNSTAPGAKTIKPLAGKMPLANKEPLAGKEPSASKEPSANKQPSASKEPSANKQPSASKEPSANKRPSASKEPSANKRPSA